MSNKFVEPFKKIYHFLFHTAGSISLREKPHVQLLYLNRKRSVIDPKDPQSAPPITIKGCIVDVDENLRKVQERGTGFYVSHPLGWLDMVAKKEHVLTCLVRTEEDEHLILIRSPNNGEVET